MCGIAGFSGQFSANNLERANDAIAHRGPDDQGLWRRPDGSVGLAHRRLSIIDLSPAGAQPMASDDGKVVLVFNGEIYNFRELRARLESEGHRFRGYSDTEAMLHLYLVHGAAMLPMLNGIFAFALWDERSAELFVARDALGVKPLYYSQSSQGFAFASEIKALLRLVPENRELDIAALHRYLTFLWCPGEGTPLKSVRKLNPGEALVVRDGRIIRQWSWYKLPVFRDVGPELSEEDSVRGTAVLLRKAVHKQLVSDVPVGAFLSGGLDSSAVVAFAREQIPGIRCFTIEASGGEDSGTTEDLPYARRVAKHLGVPLEVVRIDAQRMASDFAAMIVQLDEPLADPAPLNVLYISRLAREHGIKVLMSGAGGDDLFSEYRRHAALEYERAWRWLPGAMRRGLARASAGLDQRVPAFRRVARLFEGADLTGDRRLAAYFTWARRSELMKLYSPEFAAALGDTGAEQPMLDFLAQAPASMSQLERMLALEQRFFLADHNLIYTDKMSMAAGVEVRVPFLDLDLVDYAARIPARMKQCGRTGKWVLKKAMESYLPADVINRPKAGFGAPLRRWMRNELRPMVDDLLSPGNIGRRGLFEPAAVQRLIADNDSGRIDGAYTLLSLLGIEVWCRAFVDGETLSSPGFGRG